MLADVGATFRLAAIMVGLVVLAWAAVAPRDLSGRLVPETDPWGWQCGSICLTNSAPAPALSPADAWALEQQYIEIRGGWR